MCNFREHPEEYYWAEGYLRGKGISPQLPGYEYIKLGIVKCLVDKTCEGENILKEIFETIEKQASVIIGHGLVTPKHSAVKQAVIEAIKSTEKINPNEPSVQRTVDEKRKAVDEMILNFFNEAVKAYKEPVKAPVRRSVYFG